MEDLFNHDPNLSSLPVYDFPKYPVIYPRYNSKELPWEQTIDWKLITTWLENAPTVPKFYPVPRGFRLIDVEKKTLIQARSVEPFEYACLSYVWGTTTAFQATSRNISRLEKRGSLSSSKVPATIQDAMIACHHLGIRYLWVDRLCIQQDDNNPNREKQAQLNQMDRIYNHALVTLAVVDGDASFGFYGVSVPLDRLYLDHDDAVQDIPDSMWAKRGWTYQEAVLSRRLLIFAEVGIFLEHNEALPPPIPGNDELSDTYHKPFYHGSLNYTSAVSDYTQRSLGNENDILNAFQGVCSYLFDKKHRFGIPTIGFHDAMHWLPESTTRKRRPSQGYKVFPTWSWISVTGPVTVHEHISFIHVASWAIVREIDANGNASMEFPRPGEIVFNDFNPKDFNQKDRSKLVTAMQLAALACGFDCTSERPPGMKEFCRRRWERDAREMFMRTWPSSTHLWRACHGVDQNEQPACLKEVSEEHKRLAAVPGRILLFSQTAPLDVTQPHESKSPDENSVACGLRVGNKKVGVLFYDDKSYLEKLWKEADKVQSVALSLMSVSEVLGFFSGPSSEKRPMKDVIIVFLREYGKHYPEAIMCVMAVDCMGGGISRRLGLGFVDFRHWIELGPRKTFFVLE
ncbi:heterokaryon incompatibility protein-domain-containing protein [Phyllosticta capitalensis]